MELRGLELDDAEMVLEWRNRPGIADVMFTNETIALDDHLRWMQRVVDADDCRYWIVEHGGRPVGVAGLTDISERHRRCSWIYYIGEPDTPGPVGLAVEFEVMRIVFAELEFEKLTSEVLSNNLDVAALHERLGFRREGVLRQHIRREDGVFDVVVLSMLRQEWEATHGRRARRRAAPSA